MKDQAIHYLGLDVHQATIVATSHNESGAIAGRAAGAQCAWLRERDVAREWAVVCARRRRAAGGSGGVAGAVLAVNHGAHFGMVDAPAEERHANGDGDGPEREDDHQYLEPARELGVMCQDVVP